MVPALTSTNSSLLVSLRSGVGIRTFFGIISSFILTTRGGGDNANFIAVLERGLLVLQEADALAVDKNIHGLADESLVVQQSLLHANEARIEGLESVRNGVGDGRELQCRLVF